VTDLNEFIKTTAESRELKRALAVQNTLVGRPWKDVAGELCVCGSFIGKWRQIYEKQGTDGLRLGYKGSPGYLTVGEKAEIAEWLQKPERQNVASLRDYVFNRYGVVYQSRQSYYALLHDAELSWKKTQKKNPKADPGKVAETRVVIKDKTTLEKDKILNRDTVVLFADECHLLWGDTLGYVWGPRGERVEVPITNERERQTYYGAVNLLSGSACVMPAEAGNGAGSVKFLNMLRRNFQGRRLLIFWDRATYHRGDLIKSYLRRLHGERPEAERLIHIEYFAPNAPEQNPMEDVWLSAKRWIRSHFFEMENFRQVKDNFASFIQNFTLKTVKFDWYWKSQMI